LQDAHVCSHAAVLHHVAMQIVIHLTPSFTAICAGLGINAGTLSAACATRAYVLFCLYCF